jgi:ribosomal protein S24E
MKIEIISQKKNPLVGREEAEVRIHHEGQRTPSRQEVLKEIAHSLKANENHIIIDRIITMQGQAVSVAKILAYDKKEDVPAYKTDKMKRRMKVAKEAEASKPAEEEKGGTV